MEIERKIVIRLIRTTVSALVIGIVITFVILLLL